MTVEQQAVALGVMIGAGAALGMLFDMMTLLRHALSAGAFLTGLMDLLFGVFCAAAIIGLALFMRIDPYRLYVFAGVGIGMGLYAVTIGTLVRFIRKSVKNLVKKS